MSLIHGKSRYALLRKIGHGRHGEVFTALMFNEVNVPKIVALKRKAHSSLCNGTAEARIHNSVRHPNIVELYQAFSDTDYCYLSIEYCAKTLTTFLDTHGSLNFPQAQVMFIAILAACKEIHKNNIIHHDLKPDNILLDEKYNAKICDFGLAASTRHKDKPLGSWQYTAPTMTAENETCEDGSSDIRSIGVLL